MELNDQDILLADIESTSNKVSSSSLPTNICDWEDSVTGEVCGKKFNQRGNLL